MKGQTNISSPLISVYDNLEQAETVARYWAQVKQEDTFVVTIDARHLGRGPRLRAADLLEGEAAESDWLHCGEYLLQYRIPVQAIQNETLVARGGGGKVGFVGKK